VWRGECIARCSLYGHWSGSRPGRDVLARCGAGMAQYSVHGSGMGRVVPVVSPHHPGGLARHGSGFCHGHRGADSDGSQRRYLPTTIKVPNEACGRSMFESIQQRDRFRRVFVPMYYVPNIYSLGPLEEAYPNIWKPICDLPRGQS
jgi:hypothetical protein